MGFDTIYTDGTKEGLSVRKSSTCSKLQTWSALSYLHRLRNLLAKCSSNHAKLLAFEAADLTLRIILALCWGQCSVCAAADGA